MKVSIVLLSSVCMGILVCFTGCKDKSSDPEPELATVDLFRGDVLLCGSGNFGNVSFSLSCDPSVREKFDLAISLLHSFEYKEAEKAFVKVMDADPDCAMAYWGVAMANFHPLWTPPDRKELEKGSKILEIAEKLPKTPKEQEYLDAIGAFYNDWEKTDHRSRTKRFEKKMKELYENHKEDTEAAVFYALSLDASADPADKSYTNQKKAGEFLESLFPGRPDHPGIAHYIIHSYDYPELASRALETARKYAKIAPSSAHAQHMPSHIFTRLGLWDESIASNVNSASAAACYTESLHSKAHWSQELHALDYLVYAYLQQGDNKNALEQQRYVASIDSIFPPNDFAAAYALMAIPIRTVLENKEWENAAGLELPKIAWPWDNLPWEKAMFHFARGLGFAHMGNIEAAGNELSSLKKLHQRLVDVDEAYKAGQVLIQINAVQAWIENAKGNQTDAIKLMRKAVEMENTTSKHPVTPGELLPANELLANLLLAQDRPEEALVEYELNLKVHPNRFNGIYGAAVAAKKAKEMDKAQLYFKKLIELTRTTPSERPEIREAKAFIGQKSA